MKTVTLYQPNSIHGLFERPYPLVDFERCIEAFFGDSPLTPATKVFDHLPAVDIRETEKGYTLEMELPGYEEKDINIYVDGLNLSIASKQEEETGKQETPAEPASPSGSWLLRERRVSTFSRSFRLPENANLDEISAEFKNGILSVEIQKRPEAQKRMIQIKAKQ
jgi:HSP20 family protein